MIPEEELRSMYWDDGMTQKEIGELYGVKQTNVSYLMKKHGIETRTKSEAKLGDSVKPSKEYFEEMYWVKGMSQSTIGELCKVGQSAVCNWMRDYGIETRTVSEALMNGDFTGENSHNWHGGISGGKYCYKFNNKFKAAVRERDDYTCQLCGLNQEQNGRKLDIHHIHYDKPNCFPDVITLCRSCNSSVNANRDYWEKYFENDLIARGFYCWSLST